MILQWEQFIRKSFVAEETLPTYTINFTGWMIRWSNRYHCPYLWIIANKEFDVQVPSIEQDMQNHIEFFTTNGVPYKWYPLHHGELQLIFFVTHQRPRASSIIPSIGGFLSWGMMRSWVPSPSPPASPNVKSLLTQIQNASVWAEPNLANWLFWRFTCDVVRRIGYPQQQHL